MEQMQKDQPKQYAVMEKCVATATDMTSMPRNTSGTPLCGQPGTPTLPQSMRDMVRNWILDGAKP